MCRRSFWCWWFDWLGMNCCTLWMWARCLGYIHSCYVSRSWFAFNCGNSEHPLRGFLCCNPRGVLSYISYIGMFHSSGYHFQSSLSQTGYTVSHFCTLNRVFPANLLLFSPFAHIIFTEFLRFIEMRENVNLCIFVLNTVMLCPVLNRVRNYSTFSSR